MKNKLQAPVAGANFQCVTDGIRSKKVSVKVLDEIKRLYISDPSMTHRVWWCEYPKGNLNVLIYSKDEDSEGTYFTDPDVGIKEVLGSEYIVPEHLMKRASKKYNLVCDELTEVN